MSVNAKHACCETESAGATLQLLGMRAGTKTKRTQRMTGTTACSSKQQTVGMLIPREQGWSGEEGEEAHRLGEAETQLEKVGKVSSAEHVAQLLEESNICAWGQVLQPGSRAY